MPRCSYCNNLYKPARPMQPGRVCNEVECMAAYAEEELARRRNKQAKAERIAAMESRKVIRLAKEKLKTRRDWLKEAQIAFNAYIRERDRDKPCISCGTSLENEEVGGGYDCGHYRSVGSAPGLRFDEHNANGQCKKCNRYLAGRAVDYRRGLIARLGAGPVERLESDNEPRKWTIESLKAIKAHYVQKRKDLIASRAEATC